MADSGQIAIIDVTISFNGMESETYDVKEGRSNERLLHIGDTAILEARGSRFVGFCEDEYCNRVLTKQRTYVIDIYHDTKIFAVYEHSYD